MPHLPIVLEWHIFSVSTIYILGRIQYRISDRGALNRIQDLKLLMFGDLFWEMDGWVIDTQMAYRQQQLLMPTNDPELQYHVAKLLQPSSTYQ